MRLFSSIMPRPAASDPHARFDERLERAITRTPVLVFALDADGVVLMVHGKRELAALGFKADDLIGSSVFERFNEAPSFIRAVKAALAGKDLTVRSEIGGRMFDVTFAPSADPDVPARALGVAVDVHDLVRPASITDARPGAPSMKTINLLASELPIGIAYFDMKGRLRFANESITRIFGAGADPDAMEGEGITVLSERFLKSTVEDFDGFMKRMREIQEAHREVSGERIRLKNGMEIERDYRPLHDSTGTMIGHLWIVKDVTSDVRSNEALEASEEFADVILDYSIDMVTLTDEKGVIKRVSRVAEKLVGYREDEMIGVSTFDFMHPDDRKSVMEKLVFLLNNPTAPSPVAVYRFRHKDGRWIWVESVASNMLTNPTVNALLVNTRDITQRIADERELKERARQQTYLMSFTRTAATMESEKDLGDTLLRSATQALGAKYGALMRVNDDGRLVLTDSTGLDENWTSSEEATVPFDSVTQIGLAGETARPVMTEDISADTRFAPSKLQEFHGFRSAIAAPLLSGGRIWGAIAVYDKEPKTFGVEETAFVETLANVFASALDRLGNLGAAKDMDILKGNFLQIVGHQLRTPMNAIRWNLDLLLEGEYGALTDEQSATLRTMYEANTNSIKRIDDFLTAMDAQSGKLTLSKTPFSLNDLCEIAVKADVKRCENKGLACKFSAKTPSDEVNADIRRIRDVLNVLLDNAIDYSNEGEIDVVTKKKGDRVRVEVRDRGVGVAKTDRPRLFTLFYRGTDAHKLKPDASGLGLYIAKTIVELHGGSIGVSDRKDGGSVFWFELPADRSSAHDHEAPVLDAK